MSGLDPKDAERGMWPGLIAIAFGITLYILAVPAVAISGGEIAALITIGVAVLIALGGVISLIVKVLRDRARDAKTDRYSRDVDQ